MSQSTNVIYSGGTAPGNTTMPAIQDHLAANISMNAGDTEPSYKVQGTLWYDTDTDKVKFYDGSAWIVLMNVSEANDDAAPVSRGVALDVKQSIFTDGDSTPDVSTALSWATGDTSANTITTFDGAVAGQPLFVRATNSNTTLGSGLTKTGMTIPLIDGDTWYGIYDGSAWQQVGGSVGMGRFVSITPSDPLSTWISGTDTTYQDVDTSEAVREGATDVLVRIRIIAVSTTYVNVKAREKGSSDDNGGVIVLAKDPVAIGDRIFGECTIPLDDDAVMQAKFVASLGALTYNNCYMIGYYI